MGSGNRFFCDEHAEDGDAPMICYTCSSPATHVHHYETSEDRDEDELLAALSLVLRGWCGARSGSRHEAWNHPDEKVGRNNRLDSMSRLRCAAEAYFTATGRTKWDWK